MNQFSFSEDHIRKTNRIFLIIFPATIAAAGFGLNVIAEHDIRGVLIALSIAALTSLGILAIQIPRTNRRLRKMKVLVCDDRLVKEFGRGRQEVTWDNVATISLTENVDGSVEAVRLYQRGPKPICLAGFDEMERIAELIQSKVSDQVPVRKKRYILNWHNPVLIIAISAGTVILVSTIGSLGNRAMLLFTAICGLCAGSGMLLFRPLTKFDPSNKRSELISATLLLMFGLLAAVLFLLLPKLF